MREFESGSTRDDDSEKLDPEGFLSPIVIQRYSQYLHKHRIQADGKLRDSDNWQKGMGLSVYMKSGYRHFLDWWLDHRGYTSREGIEDALCGLIFNAMGYLFEILKNQPDLNIEPPKFDTVTEGYRPKKADLDLENMITIDKNKFKKILKILPDSLQSYIRKTLYNREED